VPPVDGAVERAELQLAGAGWRRREYRRGEGSGAGGFLIMAGSFRKLLE